MEIIYLFNVLYKGSSRFNSMWSKLLTDSSKQTKHLKKSVKVFNPILHENKSVAREK